MSNESVELLSPAGDFTTALAAFDAGADAVYCGLGDFSARAFATNFSLEDLKNLLRVAHARGRKVYVTFNTLVDEDALETAVTRLADLAEARPDALIVQDLGVARLVRRHFPELALHASTQLVAHNLEGVLALKELGFTRVVLARELSLAEIASIAKRCGGLELECFIHGALCYSVSGLCLFSAMEKGRSGNRGACAYCCRLGYDKPSVDAKSVRVPPVDAKSVRVPVDAKSVRVYPFSMKDLRLGEDVRKLVDAGVASLKIEGRMKSSVYVASVTKYYRQILGDRSEDARRKVTVSDLETVFSRRTTELYLNGPSTSNLQPSTSSPIDPTSLGHLGTRIGTVKRVTKDREGRSWIRFHTSRALERHDGLQFSPAREGEKPFGFGISEMRTALSRATVFEVAAGTDVEVLLPPVDAKSVRVPHVDAKSVRVLPVDAKSVRVLPVDAKSVRVPPVDAKSVRVLPVDAKSVRVLPVDAKSVFPGAEVFCSMSNAVKRMFPEPSFRPSDYAGEIALDMTVTLEADKITAEATCGRAGARPSREGVRVSVAGAFAPAKDPSRTYGAIEKALGKLGGTDYRLGRLVVNDADRLFAPASLLNDLRRDLVESVDARRAERRRARIEAALVDAKSVRVVKEDDFSAVTRTDFASTGTRTDFASTGTRTDFASTGTRTDFASTGARRQLRLRAGQTVPAGDWDEVVVLLSLGSGRRAAPTSDADLAPYAALADRLRLALPVYTKEPDFNALRTLVKHFLRAGYAKWEASDLATLRMLKALGVADLTADWTLYAFNSQALAALAELGVTRFVASPENHPANVRYLAESGYDVAGLVQQSTPLFISLTEPERLPCGDLRIYPQDGLWITTKRAPRTFSPPKDMATRTDLSWDPPLEEDPA